MSFPIIREIWAKERCTNESFSVLGCINKICHVYETFNIAWGSGMDVLVGRMSAE